MRRTWKTYAVIAAVVAAYMSFGYVDVKVENQAARDFARESEEINLHAKTIRSVRTLYNPVTWISGKPRFVAARREIDGNFLVVFLKMEENRRIMDKALIRPECGNNIVSFVDRRLYERHRENHGYDVLGNKLSKWAQANYYDMLSVFQGKEEPGTGGPRSVFFDIACNWERFGPVSKNVFP